MTSHCSVAELQHLPLGPVWYTVLGHRFHGQCPVRPKHIWPRIRSHYLNETYLQGEVWLELQKTRLSILLDLKFYPEIQVMRGIYWSERKGMEQNWWWVHAQHLLSTQVRRRWNRNLYLCSPVVSSHSTPQASCGRIVNTSRKMGLAWVTSGVRVLMYQPPRLVSKFCFSFRAFWFQIDTRKFSWDALAPAYKSLLTAPSPQSPASLSTKRPTGTQTASETETTPTQLATSNTWWYTTEWTLGCEESCRVHSPKSVTLFYTTSDGWTVVISLKKKWFQ